MMIHPAILSPIVIYSMQTTWRRGCSVLSNENIQSAVIWQHYYNLFSRCVWWICYWSVILYACQKICILGNSTSGINGLQSHDFYPAVLFSRSEWKEIFTERIGDQWCKIFPNKYTQPANRTLSKNYSHLEYVYIFPDFKFHEKQLNAFGVSITIFLELFKAQISLISLAQK